MVVAEREQLESGGEGEQVDESEEGRTVRTRTNGLLPPPSYRWAVATLLAPWLPGVPGNLSLMNVSREPVALCSRPRPCSLLFS